MPDKVFVATVIADLLFLASGAMELGFSIAAMNLKDKTPTDGQDATRHLLYQRFPLIVGIVNAIFILVTFLFTVPAMALVKRNLLKISGYMITVCAVFTLAVGLYLWIMTLQLKETFLPVYENQDSSIQSLVQVSVCSPLIPPFPYTRTICAYMTSTEHKIYQTPYTNVQYSSNAAATSTPQLPPLSQTLPVPALPRPLSCADAPQTWPVSQTPLSLTFSQPSLAWSVRKISPPVISIYLEEEKTKRK